MHNIYRSRNYKQSDDVYALVNYSYIYIRIYTIIIFLDERERGLNNPEAARVLYILHARGCVAACEREETWLELLSGACAYVETQN